jgi:quercetin 2,3-dioxygenase
MSIAQSRPRTELPGEAVPYVLPAGTGRAHLLISDVGRALVGAEESNGRMSVMSNVGARAPRPIPLHFHELEYEYFYCFDGLLQLWADGESRLLVPGDFGFIPPGTIHAYQQLRNGSAFVGPITPGGWDRFFDLTGDPFPGGAYAPPPYPPPPFEKFGRAEQEFRMKYRPDLEYAPATLDAPDDTLPGERRPYFLKRSEGERHLLGGMLQTALCRAQETDGTMAITTVELPMGAGLPLHVHASTHEVLIVVEGRLRVTLDGAEHLVTRGDTVNVPPGTAHRYVSESHHAKVLSMSAPGGLERLFAVAGEATQAPIFPVEPDLRIDLDRLRAAVAELDVTLV